MGRFMGGLLMGLFLGLVFSEIIFPDGFSMAVQRLGEQIRSQIPGTP